MTVKLTPRSACEIVSHEAIVQEMYFDNATPPRATWSVGITAAAGVNVQQFKDNPAPLQTCLFAYLNLLNKKYLPEVVAAFGSHSLTENELAAALSFHWNTGAIQRTDWVKLFLAGKRSEARAFLETHYLNGGDLKKRRLAEAALFFDGKWSNDGTAMVWAVKKPSYTPDWSKGKKVRIDTILQQMMGGQ